VAESILGGICGLLTAAILLAVTVPNNPIVVSMREFVLWLSGR
jgi:hypothetical protein